MKTLVIDGFEFKYDKDTAKEGSEARISLTNLAKLLGYKNNQPLLRLAKRNAKYLYEFGSIVMVAVVHPRGDRGATEETRESSYNYHQAYYLMMRSETEVARKLAVRFTKAFFQLMERCWIIEQGAATSKLLESKLKTPTAVPKALTTAVPAPAILVEEVRNTVSAVGKSLQHLLAAAHLLEDQEGRIDGLARRLNKLEADACAAKAPTAQVSSVPSQTKALAPVRAKKAGSSTYTVNDYMRSYRVNRKVYPPTVVGKIASALYRALYRKEPPFSNAEIEVNGRARAQREYPRDVLEDAVAQYSLTGRCKIRQASWDNRQQ